MIPLLRANPRATVLIREVLLDSRWALVAYLLARLLDGGAGILLPLLLKWETDQLAATGTPLFAWVSAEPFRVLMAILGVIAAVRVLRYVLEQTIAIFEEVRVKAVDDALLLRLYARFAAAEIGIFLHERNAQAVRLAFGKSHLVCHHVKDTLGRSLGSVLACGGIAGLLAATDPLVLAAILAGALVAALAGRAEQRLRQTFAAAAAFGYEWRIFTLENEFARNLPQLVANDGHRQLAELLGRQMAHRLRETAAEARRRLAWGWASFLSANAVEVAVKMAVGYSVFHHGASVGTVVLAIMCVDQFRGAIAGLVAISLDWRLFRRDVQEIELFLEATEPGQERRSEPPPPAAIRFAGVRFAYPGIAPITLRHLDIEERELRRLGRIGPADEERLAEFAAIRAEAAVPPRTVLDGIDLELRRGEVVALVGANGAGKTTIASLILGHFDGYQGAISIDGIPAAAVSRDWFHRSIAVVHQVPYLLDSCSLRENLLLGVRRAVDDAELWRALERTGLAGRVRGLRRGLDAECNADGALSGGQRQQLAIARVLLQDRPVLILDEGTGQLDPDREAQVMAALAEDRARRITLCIGHRMAALRRADRILCLEGGRIVAAGCHEELLAAGGNPYARFWQAQTG